MNDKQISESQYNAAILSIYGGNPVASIAGSYKPKEQPQLPKLDESEKESKPVGTGALYKETRGLLLAARKNLQLKKRILAYEQRRFKQLTVDIGQSLKQPKSSSKKKDEKLVKIPKDGSNVSIRKWMRDLIKKLFDRLKSKIGRWIKRSIKRLLGKKGIQFVRRFLNPIRKFIAKGGIRGFLSRRLKKLAFKLLGKSKFRAISKFLRKGGVKGFARRQFFKSLRYAKGMAKGAISTAKSLKGLAGMAFDTIRGPASKAAVDTAGKAGRGFLAKTARNAVVATLGKSGTKTALKFVKKFVSPLIKKIPIVGALADFLLNVFVFKESPGKAAFKAISAGLLGFIGAAAGSVVPFAGTFLGGVLGGTAGDILGGLLYDAIFGGGKPTTSEGSSIPAAKDGMKVGAKPQLVLVGEGGEEEWIIPKSKLAWWLGASETALNLLTFGASPVIGTVKALLSAVGGKPSTVPDLPGEVKDQGVTAKIDAKKPQSIGSDFGSRLFDFFKKGFEKVKGVFQGLLDNIKGFLPDLSGLNDWTKNQLRWIAKIGGAGMVALVEFLLGGGGAQAATTGGGNTPGAGLTGGGYEYTDPNTETTITVTSQYGMRTHPIYGTAKMHGGTDIAAASGTPLRAFSDGEIVDSDSLGKKGWGNFLVFKDDKGIFHLYGHMQGGYKRGGKVKKGDIIGKVGSTGVSSGPHLHWEAGTGWNGGVITGKFDPLSKYTAQQPFFTAADEKDDKDKKPPTATPPATPTPKLNAQQRRRGYGRRAAATTPTPTPIPPVAPLNKKDTASALEKFGTMDEDNNQEVAVIEVPVTRTVTVPMPLPLQTASVGSSGNSPAWGQGAVLGA